MIRNLRTRLEADGSSPSSNGEGQRLAHGLGDLATRFLDPSELAARVKSTTAAKPLEPERRARLELALGRLENGNGSSESPGDTGSQTTDQERPIRVICETDLAERYGLSSSGNSRLQLAAQPCVVAAQCFDDQAARTAARIAALRVARLELDGEYVPQRHDVALEHFDWQAFHRSELDLLPTVIALVSADHVAGTGMASLSQLLLSGRPVQVIVVVEPAASPGSTDRSGFRFEPGYLGLGHREALVHQSSPAAPEHVRSGFERALDGTRASLHVLAADPGEAAIEARAHPLFLFDPEAGANWTDRFDLGGNPAPVGDWLTASLEVDTANGEATEPLELAYTYADYSLERERRSDDFLAIEPDLAASELVSLPRWLELDESDAGHAVPYLWAFDNASDGHPPQLHRLAVSRRLALECRDRLDYWRTLRQFGGLSQASSAGGEQPVDRTTPPEPPPSADREQIAAEIVGRLLHGLLDGELGPLAQAAVQTTPASEEPAARREGETPEP